MSKKQENLDNTIETIFKYCTARRMMKESSAVVVSHQVRRFIEDWGITAPDEPGLKKLADMMEDKKLSSNTRRFYINAFARWADAVGRPIDITKVFPKRPPLEKNKVNIIPSEDVPRIIEAKKSVRDQAILAVLFYTGLRVSELCRLRYGSRPEDVDVDLDEMVIYVRNRDGGTKNREEREAYILPEMVPYLRAWIEARRDYLVRQGKHSDRFFITTRCDPIRPDNVRSMMLRMRELIGLHKGDRFSPHLCRHTAASTALQNGVDPATCKEVFGWSDFKIMTRYAHSPRKKAQVEFNKKFRYNSGDDEKRRW